MGNDGTEYNAEHPWVSPRRPTHRQPLASNRFGHGSLDLFYSELNGCLPIDYMDKWKGTDNEQQIENDDSPGSLA